MRLMVSVLILLWRSLLMDFIGGYAYCAIGALSLLGRLPSTPGSNETPSGKPPGLTNIDATIRWLMSRQQIYIAVDEDSSEDEESYQVSRPRLAGIDDPNEKQPTNGASNTELPSLSGLTIDECYYAGHNGRCNKALDTCYSFWNNGSLDVCLSRHLPSSQQQANNHSFSVRAN